MDMQIPALKTKLVCLAEHVDSDFTPSWRYKVNSYQVGGNKIAGVRVRDNSRSRRDFNFNPESKNYLWKYFKIAE